MIVVDHKWRDLPSSVYLKLVLENRHHHLVQLVRLGEENALMSSFRPHMVIYNNLYDKARNEYVKYLKAMGIKIIILPTEGITFSDEQTMLFTHKYSDIGFIDLYIAWNHLMHNAIVESRILPEDKVPIMGNCRFDFYRPPLAGLLKGKEYFIKKYGIHPDLMNILVTTNFANAEFWPDTSFLEKNLAKQRAIGIQVFSQPAKLAKYEFDYRNKFFKFITDFSKQQKDINILIKYHPSERTAIYHRFVKTLKPLNRNVFLLEGDYIWDVLNISDIVLQRCSTVAIEAWLLGKHTVEVELMPSLDHFLQPRYREGSFNISTPEALSDIVAQILKDECIPIDMTEARERILDYLVFRPYGSTTERVASVLDRQFNVPIVEPGRIRPLNFKNCLKSIARSRLGMKGYDILRSLYKLKLGDYLGRYDKNFSAADIIIWERMLRPYI